MHGGNPSSQPSGSPDCQTDVALSFCGVSKSFTAPDGRGVAALRDIDLEVQRHETLCLIGTSGSGKTTLLRLANRLAEPSAGQILCAGRDIRELDPIALRRSMGYVIQTGGLFPHLSVADNIGLLCRLEGWAPERIVQRVETLLALVQLPPADFAMRRPAALSGGQRQRVGVARALALDPPVLLMDEPFGALDPITRKQLRHDFAALSRSVSKTVLLVTHDLEEAFALGDRVALLDEGRLVQVGTEDELRTRPAEAFVEHFLGGMLSTGAHSEGDHA